MKRRNEESIPSVQACPLQIHALQALACRAGRQFAQTFLWTTGTTNLKKHNRKTIARAYTQLPRLKHSKLYNDVIERSYRRVPKFSPYGLE